jgi:hypothetical protein
MSMEGLSGMILVEKLNNAEKHLWQCHFVHYKFHVDLPRHRPIMRGWQLTA